MAFTITKWNCTWQPSGELIPGVYAHNDDGELVRIGDETKTPLFDCFVPEGGYTCYNLGHNPVDIRSKSHKRVLMKAAGVREAADRG